MKVAKGEPKRKMRVLPCVAAEQHGPLKRRDARVHCKAVNGTDHGLEGREGPGEDKPDDENGDAKSQSFGPRGMP